MRELRFGSFLMIFDTWELEESKDMSGKTLNNPWKKIFKSWLDFHKIGKAQQNTKNQQETQACGSNHSHSSWTPASQGLDREGMALIEQQDADGFRKCAVGVPNSFLLFVFCSADILWGSDLWRFNLFVCFQFIFVK